MFYLASGVCSMSVRNTILALIKRHRMDNFTLSELKERCKDSVRSNSKNHFNSLIYKILWVMEKNSFLTSVQNTVSSNKKIYSLTEKGFQLLETIEIIEEPSQETAKSQNSFDSLSHRISDYSVSLAEASAEAQEYQDLSLKWPESKGFLEERYIEAKSRAAHFKGRLTAAENFLRERNDETSTMAS